MTTEADCKFYYFIIDKYLEQIQINSHASLSNPKTLQLLQGISRCYWKSENKFKMGSSNQDSGFLAIKQNIEVSNTKKFINSSCSRFLMVALILPKLISSYFIKRYLLVIHFIDLKARRLYG